MANDDFNGYEAYQAPAPREVAYYEPKHYRAAARQALKVFWTIAVLVTLLASLLGGLSYAFEYDW